MNAATEQQTIEALEDRAAEMQTNLTYAIADLKALRAAARAVVDAMAAAGTTNCPTCGAALLYQKHGWGCSLVALRALLEVS